MIAAARSKPIKVRAGVVKVRSDHAAIKKVSKNGVYTLVEVRHPDGSHSRFKVPTRSMSERLAKETARARSKAAV
ncbi:MAG: hypothetical protein LBE08_06685 [Bifidobacteriaceae bacterium]|jgi:rRNA maturation protein Nop10|nr:hypothetical protein [Bifidobacteriaceae bacterium]